MSSPGLKLQHFITANSFELVNEHFLQTGGSADAYTIEGYHINDNPKVGEPKIDPSVRFSSLSKDSNVRVSPLHQAVRNCYENFPGKVSHDAVSSALNILKALLEHGADPTIKCSFRACNVPGYNWTPLTDCTPLEFAIFLKSLAPEPPPASRRVQIEKVIEILKNKENQAGRLQPVKASIPEYTFGLWNSMLSDTEFSDVTFMCGVSDEERASKIANTAQSSSSSSSLSSSIARSVGVAVKAHKCVLAQASPYFSSLFSGHWKETEDNVILTETSGKTH